eukprot:11391527-Ditylum_brightwellii.AAC.1
MGARKHVQGTFLCEACELACKKLCAETSESYSKTQSLHCHMSKQGGSHHYANNLERQGCTST